MAALHPTFAVMLALDVCHSCPLQHTHSTGDQGMDVSNLGSCTCIHAAFFSEIRLAWLPHAEQPCDGAWLQLPR